MSNISYASRKKSNPRSMCGANINNEAEQVLQ